MLSGKWLPFCLGLNVLMLISIVSTVPLNFVSILISWGSFPTYSIDDRSAFIAI